MNTSKIKLKKFLNAFIILLAFSITYGQGKVEPSILILSPNEIKYDKSFQKEITEYNNSLIQNQNSTETEEYLTSKDFLSQSENIQIMIKSEIEYAKNIDFFKNASSISEQFLTYRFFEKFPNLLIILKDQKSDGSLTDLKSVAENNKLQYVLNFSKIELFKKENISYAQIDIQLFDKISETIILNKSYVGDWYNPGFEFGCTNESINCTINNALSKALDDIVYTIAINSPTLKKEKQLSQERLHMLSNEYLRKDFDTHLIKTVLPINYGKPFQLLINDEQSKFVAFFIEEVSAQDFKDLTKNKKDKNVQIISPNDIKDKEFLQEIPRTYAYIIKAVKYNDNWYYEKSKVTYFQANSLNEGKEQYFNNLQQWDFFQENSTELNPDFWETKLFEKVPNLKEDTEWDTYGNSIWETDEINNRNYIGLYEIVADSLRKEKQLKNTSFEENLNENVFKPTYEKLKKTNPNKYSKLSIHSLIYSENRNVAINPVLITDKKGIKKIHYFIAFKDSLKLYEWHYFEHLEVQGDLFGSEVVNQIGSLTEWNFSVDNLNDVFFWNQYVLRKQGNNYQYLKEIKE